jgi:tetrahydromethanopterin S-methyltransferase subunit A
MMDVDDPVVLEPAAPETAAPEPAEPLVELEEEEEEEEYEETIMLRASDFVAFQDILEDMRSQITDLQRNAR